MFTFFLGNSMTLFFKRGFDQSNIVIAVTMLVALLIGAVIPAYVNLMDGQIGKLIIIPALLVLGFLLAYDRKLMLLLIILFRSAGDIFLESTRFSLGGYQVGIGGLINAFVILIALMLVFEKPKVVPKHSSLIWFPFLFVAFLGIILAPVKGEAIKAWLPLLSYLMIFISAFYFVKDKADFEKCVQVVLWSSALPVMYSFVDIALHGSRVGGEGFRLQSTFGHPNIFAFYLTLVISLTFYKFKSAERSEHTKSQIFFGAYLFLLLALLMLTKTRSAWMGCFISFALYGVFFERKYLLYLMLLPVVAIFIPGVADRLADLGQGNEVINYSKLNSFAWRVQLWDSAFRWTLPKDYLLGHGLQSFKEYSPIFFPLAGKINWGAHSVYVQLLFDLGIVGLCSFLWLYYKVLFELKAMLKFDRLGAFLLIIVLLNYLVFAFSDNMLDYLTFNWYLWFILGAGFALVLVSVRGKESEVS